MQCVYSWILSKRINISVYCVNVCGILNKLADLVTFVLINNPAVVSICETHTSSDVPDELICLNGYRIFRKDRN